MSENAVHDRPTDRPADRTGDRRFTPPVVAACVLAGLLLVSVAVAGIVLYPRDTASTAAPPVTGPVGLVPVDAPGANTPSCTGLLAKLPDSLPNSGPALPRRPIAKPAPPAVAAWGDLAQPVVLRCGVARPEELTPTSETLTVSGVRWLQVNGTDSATWYAVDRPVYIALTLPGGLSTGPIQEVSSIIGATLPPTPLRFSGTG